MKKLLCFAVFAFVVGGIGRVLAQPMALTFLNEREYKSAMGDPQFEAGSEATTFTPKGNVAPVYFDIKFKDPAKITVKDKLQMSVFLVKNGAEEYAYQQEFGVPKKVGKIQFHSNFPPGEYVARVFDKDNEKDVFASGTFKVTAATTPDYKNNCTFVTCKSVDDNWNPIGETKKIKAGECTQFLYKAKDKINNYAMVWAIRRVKPNGDEEYVNDLLQMLDGNPWRFVATDNVCEFSTPGKYRVYLIEKNESDALHGGTISSYFGKMEFAVE